MLTQLLAPSQRTLLALILLSFIAPHQSSLAQSFTPLGPIPQGTSSTAKALSRDGTTIVGVGNVTVGNNTYPQPFRWTFAGGITRLPSGQVASANGVSSDGQVVVGTSGVQAGFRPSFRWTLSSGLQNTGTLPGGTYAYLEGCNPDGSLVTGVSYGPDAPNGRAAAWTAAVGMLPLPMPIGDTFSAAPGITPDGTLIVGSSGSYAVVPPTSRAIRWTSFSSFEDIGVLPNVSHSAAAAVSDDGQIIVGASGNFYDPNGNSSIHAFRWTRATGMQELNAPRQYSRAFGISADGAAVVGTAGFRTGPAAFLWTHDLGLVNLNRYLTMLGATPGVLNLQSAIGISADGRTVAGTALRSDTFQDEAWIATLPSPLPPCLTLSPVLITPGCPREHVSLSINATVTTPYQYTWQVRTASGEWIDIAGTVAVGCQSGTGGAITQTTTRDLASPTLNLLIRPCGGLTTFTFRVLVYSDCAAKASDEGTYTICPADFDCDGTASIVDIFAYLNAWFEGVDATDFDGSGPGTVSNVMAFIDAWFAGC
jgi:uncharacterized membrane protein